MLHLAGHSSQIQNGNFGIREGKNIRQGRKRIENSTVALKSWISNQTKLRQFARRFFGETLCEASRHIKRLTKSILCYEGSKSEIRGVGNRSAAVEGETISLSSTASALWDFR
ncbi:hypothetical protein AVEN_64913-1 [Araneus ventricosus]|uniref:Uncharacterized protein n=1 Tax=Araneus ventricosus TaxID=182803 RepID=A0A4Y2RB24_ARAVE|nr:hypothetical protein AVEN_64913-1 [Araneus ventricosus]